MMRQRRFYQLLTSFTGFLTFIMLTGCDATEHSANKFKKTNSNLVIEQSIIPSQPAEPANEAPATASREAQVASSVVQSLEVSYARLAASQNDVCPKLLEFQFATQSLVRNNERLLNKTCEYYVYLKPDERLKVTNSSDVKAELISPVWFDFQNGEFKAPRFDRYTIRISYNGTRYNPQNFAYDIILTKNQSRNSH